MRGAGWVTAPPSRPLSLLLYPTALHRFMIHSLRALDHALECVVPSHERTARIPDPCGERRIAEQPLECGGPRARVERPNEQSRFARCDDVGVSSRPRRHEWQAECHPLEERE